MQKTFAICSRMSVDCILNVDRTSDAWRNRCTINTAAGCHWIVSSIIGCIMYVQRTFKRQSTLLCCAMVSSNIGCTMKRIPQHCFLCNGLSKHKMYKRSKVVQKASHDVCWLCSGFTKHWMYYELQKTFKRHPRTLFTIVQWFLQTSDVLWTF